MTHYYILSFGSNISDAESVMHRAISRLDAIGTVITFSGIYVTKAEGAKAGSVPDYHNAVAGIESRLTPDEICAFCKDTEKELGRTQEDKATGIVTIDIDVVMADGEVLRPRDYTREYFRRGYLILGNRTKE